MIVEVMGVVPVLVVVNDMLDPDPELTNPIAELLLVQLYVVVPTVLGVVKLITATSDTQKTSSKGWFTSAEGFTVIWNVSDAPKQLIPL